MVSQHQEADSVPPVLIKSISTVAPSSTLPQIFVPQIIHIKSHVAKNLCFRGQYSTSVLESLESQNENDQTSILSGKVSQLKQLTMAIGEEIRDSSSLAESINTSFENTGVRLKGTMRRMLRMAERTGVGWKVWILFFLAVWAIFAYVWLF